MRIVHTADNHLDMPLASLPPDKKLQRKAQRRASFSKIIDFAIKNRADMLLISGDLFHTPTPSPSTVSFCFNEFERLGNIPVFISLGNHDWGAQGFRFPANVHVFSSDFETVRCKNALVTGASFASMSADFSSQIPPVLPSENISILCLHADIITKSEYNPIDKDFLSSLGYDYIALGHVHNFYKYNNIVYPGCHDGGGFDEPGEKGFVFLDTDNSVSQVAFIPSSSAVYTTTDVDISDYSSSLEVADYLENTLSPDGIYKITLTGKLKGDFIPNIDFISDYISQRVFFAKIDDNTTFDIDISHSRLYTLFAEYLNNTDDEEIAALAYRYGVSALKGDDTDI